MPTVEDNAIATAAEPVRFRRRETPFTVNGRTHRFLLATPEGEQWYDPPKPHAVLEYEWVARHVPLRGEVVYDVGSHHGHYALVLAGEGPRKLVCVDAVEANCLITRANLSLNGLPADVRHLAVSTRDGTVEFTGDTNGRVVDRGTVRVPSATLATLAADATVIKLDIEGEEFRVLPAALDALPGVHTWVVEVHPWTTRDPHALMPHLSGRFDVWWVNKAAGVVEPYPANADWSGHTTVVCRRKGTR